MLTEAVISMRENKWTETIFFIAPEGKLIYKLTFSPQTHITTAFKFWYVSVIDAFTIKYNTKNLQNMVKDKSCAGKHV